VSLLIDVLDDNLGVVVRVDVVARRRLSMQLGADYRCCCWRRLSEDAESTRVAQRPCARALAGSPWNFLL
jgi:hypothetical protein